VPQMPTQDQHKRMSLTVSIEDVRAGRLPEGYHLEVVIGFDLLSGHTFYKRVDKIPEDCQHFRIVWTMINRTVARV
jgi:hypothetical protein